MPLRANAHLLEGALAIATPLVDLRAVCETPRTQSAPLEDLVFGVEVEEVIIVGGFGSLRLLLRPVVRGGELRGYLVVGLREYHIVREGVGLGFGDRPGDFFQEHAVHGGHDFGGDVDEAIGEDEPDWGDGGLGEERGEGGESRGTGCFATEVGGYC